MRALLVLLWAGCSGSPCDGLPSACVEIEVHSLRPIDEIDLVVTTSLGKRLTARESRLDGRPMSLPARFAAIVPGDGSFALAGVGAFGGAAEAYGDTHFSLPPHRQTVQLTLFSLTNSGDGGELADLGGFQIGDDLARAPADLSTVLDPRADLLSESPSSDLAVSPSSDLAAPKGWAPEVSGTSADLNQLWGDGSGKIVVVGDKGTILYTLDGGALWQSASSGGSDELYGVWGSSAGDVWAVGEEATVLHSSNGGESWTQKSIAPSGSIITLGGVWGWGAGKLYTVGGEVNGGDSFDTNDGAKSWSSGATSQVMEAVWGASATNIYAVGASGMVAHITTSEEEWVEHAKLTDQTFAGIWGSGPSDIYAVGEKGVIFHSGDGSSWTALTSGTTVTLSWIWGSSPSDIYVVGDAGTILHSTDGGKSWPAEPSGTGADLIGVWGSGSDVYVCGAGGVILARN